MVAATASQSSLASAYSASLDRALEAGARSVAFPAISCGVYGYPLDEAADVALSAVRAWLESHPGSGIEDIIFVLRGAAVMAVFRASLDHRVNGVLEAAAGNHEAGPGSLARRSDRQSRCS